MWTKVLLQFSIAGVLFANARQIEPTGGDGTIASGTKVDAQPAIPSIEKPETATAVPTNTTAAVEGSSRTVGDHAPDTVATVAPDGSVDIASSRAAAATDAAVDAKDSFSRAAVSTDATADAKDSVRAQTDETTTAAVTSAAAVTPHEQAPEAIETVPAKVPITATESTQAPAQEPQPPVSAGSFVGSAEHVADDTTTTSTSTAAPTSTQYDPSKIGTPGEYATSTSAASCFEGGTGLETIHGTVRMDEAQVGDWVRTAIGFEPILGWFHSSKDAQGMEFLKISTDSGEVLTLTPSHVLYLANGLLVAAESLNLGDSILTNDGEVTMVTGVEKTSSDSGFYNPITASTSVVVNGILASTFTMDLGIFTSAAMLSTHTMIVTGVARVAQLFGLDKKGQPPVAPQVAVASS